METPPEKRKSEKFIADAAKLNSRRAQGGLLLLEGSQGWLERGSSTAEFYAAASSCVTDALYVLLAEPTGPWPPVLEILLSPELDRRYPEIDYGSAGFAPVSLALDYVVAQCVVRGLLTRPLVERHQDIATKAVQSLGTMFDPKRADLRDPWRAKEAVLMLVFGDHAGVVRKFEAEWKLDLGADENCHRALIKLSYLLARCALGTGAKDFPYFARSLATLIQFKYYQWSVNEDLSAMVDLPMMVLASQLYCRMFAPEAADATTMLGSLAPPAVVTRMFQLRTP